MANKVTGLRADQKRFYDIFRKLTYRQSDWQAWADFVTMAACAISNSVDRSPKAAERERLYLAAIKRYTKEEQELFPQLFAATVDALEEDPEQDYLGVLFQTLELSNHWHGQFFTPYNVCRMMAKMAVGEDDRTRIENEGTLSVNDPACGAGALLIAAANAFRAAGINYQNCVEFVAQDIDHTAAMMCYIQISLLGCPGYVIVGDTLRHPATDPLPPGYEVWYTPFWYSELWQMRLQIKAAKKALKAFGVPQKPDKSRLNRSSFFFFFYDNVLHSSAKTKEN